MYDTLLTLLRDACMRYKEKTVYKDSSGQMTFGQLDDLSAAAGDFIASFMEERYG